MNMSKGKAGPGDMMMNMNKGNGKDGKYNLGKGNEL